MGMFHAQFDDETDKKIEKVYEIDPHFATIIVNKLVDELVFPEEKEGNA